MITSSTSNVTTTYGVGTSGGCLGLLMCFITIQTKIKQQLIGSTYYILVFLPAK